MTQIDERLSIMVDVSRNHDLDSALHNTRNISAFEALYAACVIGANRGASEAPES